MDWFMDEDFVEPDHPEMPHEEIDVSTMESNWSSGLSAGSCPAATTVILPNGKSHTPDYTDICSAISTVFKPILLFSILILSGFILSGVRR